MLLELEVLFVVGEVRFHVPRGGQETVALRNNSNLNLTQPREVVMQLKLRQTIAFAP